jgi:OHCU decarboxylase
MQLDQLNALDRPAIERELLRCCGSERWAREMAARRPWPSLQAMADDADTIWRGLSTLDHLQAFAAHPRIGVTGATAAAGAGDRGRSEDTSWSAQEQSRVLAASDDLRNRLAAANDRYQARFGFIFLVCATGRSAEELLVAVDERLTHSREDELRIAADEQRKITRLRLKKLVAG